MANIIDLEIKNLSKQEKEYWLGFLIEYAPERIEETKKLVGWSENIEKSKKLDLLGKTLKKYFVNYRYDFVPFQQSHKNSLYNQAVEANNFKRLDYWDMIRNLTPEQKDKVVTNISRLHENLKGRQINYSDKNVIIHYGLHNDHIARTILPEFEHILNPLYQVNKWIEKKHQLELVKKDELDQKQKFEVPKMKM